MSIDNRTLLLIRYLIQATVFLLLVGALVWGFLMRVISGEAYLGFVVAILTFMRDRPVFMLEEQPRIIGVSARHMVPGEPDDRGRVTP